jgi:hypothetical protein
VTNPIRYFLENFGKEPEPRPPIIPGPWRIPFFVALIVASLIALGLLVQYVVIPGIQAQHTSAPAPISAPVK